MWKCGSCCTVFQNDFVEHLKLDTDVVIILLKICMKAIFIERFTSNDYRPYSKSFLWNGVTLCDISLSYGKA